MKKLLAMLGSLIISASAASTVLACSTTQAESNKADGSQTDRITAEAVNSLKNYIIADQYGLDLNQVEKLNTSNDVEDFGTLNSDAAKGLNLSGTIGKDCAPLYDWNKRLNNFLKPFGTSVDLTPYLDKFGGTIKDVPYQLESNNINSFFELVSFILTNAAGYTDNLNIKQSNINRLFKFIKEHGKDIANALDLNEAVRKIVQSATDKGATPNMIYIKKAGMDALNDLGTVLFDSYADGLDNYETNPDDPNDQSKDNPISAFLGTQIFTNLLNGKPIPWDSITSNLKDWKNILTWALSTPEILDDVSTFLASVALNMTVYIPLTMNLATGVYKTTDPNSFFFDKDGKSMGKNQDVYNKLDAETIAAPDGQDGITIGDEKVSVSLNDTIFGMIDLLSDTNPDDFAIQRLLGILLHDNYEADGKTLSKDNTLTMITYWLVDALKFTDYQISTALEISAPIKIKGNINFNIKDLFKTGEISLISESSFGPVSIKITDDEEYGVGLLGMNYKAIEPFVNAVLMSPAVDKNWGTKVLKPLLGKLFGGSDNSVQDSFTLMNGDKPLMQNFLFKTGGLNIVASKIGAPILQGILNTIWYTNGDSLIKGLSSSGLIKTDTPEQKQQWQDTQDKIHSTFPISNKIRDALSNTLIGDLTKYSGVVDLDQIGILAQVILGANPIQKDSLPTDSSNVALADAKYNESLAEQILMTFVKDKQPVRGDLWSYYIGAVKNDDIKSISDTKIAKDDHYVLKDSILGILISSIYPSIKDGTANNIRANTVIDKVDATNISTLDGKGTGTVSLIDASNLSFLVDKTPGITKLDANMQALGDSWQGEDINDIVGELLDDNNAGKIWTTANSQAKLFDGTQAISNGSFNLTFDTNAVDIKHLGKDMPKKKATYKITYWRIDNNSKFNIRSIEKIS